jgi:hypothetical protein
VNFGQNWREFTEKSRSRRQNAAAITRDLPIPFAQSAFFVARCGFVDARINQMSQKCVALLQSAPITRDIGEISGLGFAQFEIEKAAAFFGLASEQNQIVRKKRHDLQLSQPSRDGAFWHAADFHFARDGVAFDAPVVFETPQVAATRRKLDFGIKPGRAFVPANQFAITLDERRFCCRQHANRFQQVSFALTIIAGERDEARRKVKFLRAVVAENWLSEAI